MVRSGSIQNNSSRYVHGGITEVGNERLEFWERRPIALNNEDSTYILEQFYEGRPDLLANAIYGDTRLWWVICQANNILDIQKEFTAGRSLILPSKARLQQDILTGSTGGRPSRRIPRVDQISSDSR